jgi:hypothetical protein
MSYFNLNFDHFLELKTRGASYCIPKTHFQLVFTSKHLKNIIKPILSLKNSSISLISKLNQIKIHLRPSIYFYDDEIKKNSNHLYETSLCKTNQLTSRLVIFIVGMYSTDLFLSPSIFHFNIQGLKRKEIKI